MDGTELQKDEADVSLEDDDSSTDWHCSRNDRGIHQDGAAVGCLRKDILHADGGRAPAGELDRDPPHHGRSQAGDGGREIEVPGEQRTAVYCRVSSHEQKAKGDLDRQVQVAVEHCTVAGLGNPRVYADVGSGLNANRGGLKRLCKAIERGLVHHVVVTYKDRLTRFGFGYLDRYFKSHGTSITVMRQAATRSMHEELVDDLVAIVTSFSGRVHGLRGQHKRSKPLSAVEMLTIERLVTREISKAINVAVRRIVAI